MQRHYRETTVDLTKTAQGRDCTLRVAGYGNCNTSDSTAFCHAPSKDDGRSIKSPDWWGAFGCSTCHDLIDKRTKVFDEAIGRQRHLTKDEISEAWLRGIYETQRIWNEEGHIVF